MNLSDKEFIQLLGKKIKSIRKKQKMTQLDVAVRADMEENAFQRIESARTNPSVKTLLKVAKALDVSVKELFDFDKHKTLNT